MTALADPRFGPRLPDLTKDRPYQSRDRTRGGGLLLPRGDWDTLLAAAALGEGIEPKPEWVGLRDQAIISLFLYAGLWLEEMLALSVRDVRLDTKGAEMLRVTGRRARTLDLHPTPLALLHLWLRLRPDVRLGRPDALWVGQAGQPLAASTIRRNIVKEAGQTAHLLLDREGRSQVNPMVLRNSFGVELWRRSGGDELLVGRYLGSSEMRHFAALAHRGEAGAIAPHVAVRTL